MTYASESRDSAIAEDLIAWFLENGNHECFAACLFQCYDLLRPDVILELAWRHNIMDFAMPFIIQVLREYTTKVDRLQQSDQERAKEKEQAEGQPVALGEPQLMITAGPGIGMAPPGMMPPPMPQAGFVPMGVPYQQPGYGPM
jgi:clathrin heavy chain